MFKQYKRKKVAFEYLRDGLSGRGFEWEAYDAEKIKVNGAIVVVATLLAILLLIPMAIGMTFLAQPDDDPRQ